jgi:molecular chaperone IbpA
MRNNFDFSPLYRSSIGFDRMFDLLENASRVETTESWPPYDITKTGDDTYRITMAVAGFVQDDLEISAQPNLLIVSARKRAEARGEYLHRGIAARPFTRHFELADHVKVTAATLVNGLLTIELQRELPEAMKPRRIAISSSPFGATRQITEQSKAT